MLYYKGSLARGLMDVFPALRVDESMFSILPSMSNIFLFCLLILVFVVYCLFNIY